MKKLTSILLAIVLAVNLLSVMSFAENGCVNRDRTLTAETMSAEMAQVAEEEMTVIRDYKRSIRQ
mgnify:CR=1 FL=1